MARPELIGVSSSIRDSEIAGLTDAEQDRVIAEEAQRLQAHLRTFVGGIQPHRGRPLVFDVTGPHQDPLQGIVHVHTVAGYFDLDALPTDSDAYKVHVLKDPTATEGNARPEGTTR